MHESRNCFYLAIYLVPDSLLLKSAAIPSSTSSHKRLHVTAIIKYCYSHYPPILFLSKPIPLVPLIYLSLVYRHVTLVVHVHFAYRIRRTPPRVAGCLKLESEGIYCGYFGRFLGVVWTGALSGYRSSPWQTGYQFWQCPICDGHTSRDSGS
jgi:hypothetical protein